MSDGETTWTYTYNADGLRTQRTNGTTTYKYYYNGSQLSRMTVGSTTLDFTYDANGTPLTITRNGEVYYYVTNLQGDVVGILNDSGTLVADYVYDAWGNFQCGGSEYLEFENPLTYRGYIYDHETGLYYLQSRYYNPQWGRFINADNRISGVGGDVLGYNMFAYCMNNPINMSDHTGGWPSWNTIFKVAATVLAVTAVAVAVVATAGALGVAAGVVTTAIVKVAVIGTAVGAIVAGTTNAVVQGATKEEENIDYNEMATSTAIGATTGSISGGASAIVPTAASGTTALVAQKGCQVAINTVISVSTYMLTTPEPTVQGFGVAFGSGIISGVTFNEPFLRSLAYSIGLEFSGYIDEFIDFFFD